MILLKKTVYNKLVCKVNAMNTSGFVPKTHHNTDNLGIENKTDDTDKIIPDTSELVKKLIIMGKLLRQKAKNLVLQV